MSGADSIWLRPGGGAGGGGAGGKFDDLAADQAAKLLRLGIAGKRRAVDDLIARLRGPDAEAWLASVMHTPPFSTVGIDEAGLVSGSAGSDKLGSLKDHGKSQAAGTSDRDAYLSGLAAYYLAIASSLVHHGKLISTTPRDELDEAMLDLAEAMPERLADLLARASLAGRGGAGAGR